MVSIDEVQSANDEFFRNRSLVAVLIGATSGIGEYTARAMATLYGKHTVSLRLYIVGRNSTAAQNIISECSRLCPNGSFQFVKAGDLASIKEVDRVSNELLGIERQQNRDSVPRIDFLMMTQGQVVFGPRRGMSHFSSRLAVPVDQWSRAYLTTVVETTEGLDRTMSLIYYSRIRFIVKLMPLLQAAPNSASVISVYAAGLEGKLFDGDLSLRDPKHYGQINVRSHNTYMTTMAFEHLAKEHPELSLVHTFPGIVITPSYSDSSFPLWFKIIWRMMGPLVRRFQAIPPEASGSRHIFLGTSRFSSALSSKSKGNISSYAEGTDGIRGTGAYAVGSDSEVVAGKANYGKLRTEGFKNKVWDHTTVAFNNIEAGRTFSE